MNRHDDPGQRFHVTERELSDGFDAVMDTIQGLAAPEIAELKLQADAAEIGHDAYALGRKLLEYGQLEEAQDCLRTAARYHVAGARRMLDEIKIHGAVDTEAGDMGSVSGPARGAAASTGAADSGTTFGNHQAAVATALVSKGAVAATSVGGIVLSPSHESLARGMSSSVPGTIFALTSTGGMKLGPGEGRELSFGRNRPEVHVCLGESDPQVSRHQGTLTYRDGRWSVINTGRLPIRCAGSRLLFRGEEPLPLDPGYTWLFVGGSQGREHLLEVYVTGLEDKRPVPRHADVTKPPRVWALTEQEKLALVALGRRYLLHEPRPRPLTFQQTAAQLAALQPQAGWTAKRVEHTVNAVRMRLSRDGVPWLTRKEVGEPVGNTLNDHLIRTLMESTTLVPMDLALIDAA